MKRPLHLFNKVLPPATNDVSEFVLDILFRVFIDRSLSQWNIFETATPLHR